MWDKAEKNKMWMAEQRWVCLCAYCRAPHRQVTRLPVDFYTQIGWKMVFLRTASLRQAKPQLNLNWEVTFGPRDVPLRTETHLSPHICRNHVHELFTNDSASCIDRAVFFFGYLTLSCWSAGLVVELMQRQNMSLEIAGCCLMLQRVWQGRRRGIFTNRENYIHAPRFLLWQKCLSLTKKFCFNVQTNIKHRKMWRSVGSAMYQWMSIAYRIIG